MNATQHAEDPAWLRTLYDAARQRGGGNVDRGVIEICAEVLAAEHPDDLNGASHRVIYPRMVEVLTHCEGLSQDEARHRAGTIANQSVLRAQDLIDGEKERRQHAREVLASAADVPAGKPSPWSVARTATSFLAETEGVVDFLDADMDRLLALGSITEIFSPRGLCKTHYAHWLAVRLEQAGKRVLLVDRDNSRRELKRRLRCWGADGCENLKVLTRDVAPALTDSTSWSQFPIEGYDVVIIDSLDSSAEGVGEQDSARPSRAIAAILNVARHKEGPAVLVLGNVIKSGAHSRGSGVVEDRADIVFEVRDATNLQPTGTKAWWEELPPAGADAWASRATRRHKRDKYRLAFVPSKFRIGEEPDPFCVELDLSTEPWAMRNVTSDLIAAGDAAQQAAEKDREAKRQLAVRALRDVIATKPVLLGQAVKLLQAHGLSRDTARQIVDQGTGWALEPGVGKGNPIVLVPCGEKVTGGEEGDAGKPHQKPLFAGSISPAHGAQGPEKSDVQEPAPDKAFRDPLFLRLTASVPPGKEVIDV